MKAIHTPCADCQVGQGRNCHCHQPKRRSWCISRAEFWRLALAALAIGYGAVALMLWLAHIRSSL